MPRALFWVLFGCLVVGGGLFGVRWGQAAALVDAVDQALRSKGIPVVAVSADISGRLVITYRHGADGHAGPNAPFYNDQIDATLREAARGLQAYRLTILDEAGGVVLAATLPLIVAREAPPQRRDPAAVQAAFQGVVEGVRATFREGDAGVGAVIQLTLPGGDRQRALNAAVQQLNRVAEEEQANGLTRLSLRVESADGEPIFTLLADYANRVWRAWHAPGLRNPLADGPPGP